MLPEGDRWFAVIGLPTWVPVGGYPLEIAGPSGTLASESVTISEGGFQFESIDLPPEAGNLLLDSARIEEERIRVEQIVSAFTPERYWSGAWLVPAQGVVSNPFGLQRSINGGPYFPHSGTDIAADLGTPVFAAASGVVALAEQLFLYGNSVIIDHGAGVFSGYGHLDRLAVAVGQWVNQGDLIGYMGTTGLSSGPHVHWEAIVHGVRVDPMLWTQSAVEP
jgi:murein DD-endopeptidase MepM/ murein hydrolase activator NlpD